MREELLRTFANGNEVQIKFRGEIQPEPMIGTLEEKYLSGAPTPYFVFNAKILMRTGQHTPPRQVTMPMAFDAADVLWVSEGPLNEDGDRLVINPSNNGKGTGGSGLVIPPR